MLMLNALKLRLVLPLIGLVALCAVVIAPALAAVEDAVGYAELQNQTTTTIAANGTSYTVAEIWATDQDPSEDPIAVTAMSVSNPGYDLAGTCAQSYTAVPTVTLNHTLAQKFVAEKVGELKLEITPEGTNNECVTWRAVVTVFFTQTFGP